MRLSYPVSHYMLSITSLLFIDFSNASWNERSIQFNHLDRKVFETMKRKPFVFGFKTKMSEEERKKSLQIFSFVWRIYSVKCMIIRLLYFCVVSVQTESSQRESMDSRKLKRNRQCVDGIRTPSSFAFASLIKKSDEINKDNGRPAETR